MGEAPSCFSCCDQQCRARHADLHALEIGERRDRLARHDADRRMDQRGQHLDAFVARDLAEPFAHRRIGQHLGALRHAGDDTRHGQHGEARLEAFVDAGCVDRDLDRAHGDTLDGRLGRAQLARRIDVRLDFAGACGLDAGLQKLEPLGIKIVRGGGGELHGEVFRARPAEKPRPPASARPGTAFKSSRREMCIVRFLIRIFCCQWMSQCTPASETAGT